MEIRSDWFKRHLNWTTAIILAGSGLFGYLLILFLNYADLIDIPIFSFSICTGVIVTNALAVYCFAWILKQKNRSRKFLILFIPMFIPMPAPYAAAILFLPFWVAGFFVVLALKKKDR